MVDAVNELEGKVAIVTGSSRNIGRFTAEELARAGAAVVIHGRSSMDICEEVAQEIVKNGGKAIAVQADIGDEEDVAAMMKTVADEFGGIDILINNASWRNIVPFEELDWKTYESARRVAMDGCFICSRAVLPYMIPRGEGNIIGIGGVGSVKGVPGRSHAAATKAGMHAMIRGMSLDLAKYNIRCNICVVGNFDTIREGSSSVEPTHLASSEIPIGRLGHPQDMANLIRFVVGPNGSYITGQTIHCNGGLYMAL